MLSTACRVEKLMVVMGPCCWMPSPKPSWWLERPSWHLICFWAQNIITTSDATDKRSSCTHRERERVRERARERARERERWNMALSLLLFADRYDGVDKQSWSWSHSRSLHVEVSFHICSSRAGRQCALTCQLLAIEMSAQLVVVAIASCCSNCCCCCCNCNLYFVFGCKFVAWVFWLRALVAP